MAEERIPSADDLIEAAKLKSRPSWWQRVDMLIWAIDKLTGDDMPWVRIGEPNAAAGHPGHEEDLDTHYEKELVAATASRNEWQFGQLLEDARR